MPLPPVILSAIGLAASNEKVQQGAETLMKSVYGKLFSKDAAQKVPGEKLTAEEIMSDLPTREELSASFAFLQAALDEQNREVKASITELQDEMTRLGRANKSLVIAIIALQLVALVLVASLFFV